MGAWQFKLFCCDLDLNIVSELSEECGLKDLEKKDGKKPVKSANPLDSSPAAERQAEHALWAAQHPGNAAENANAKVTHHEFPKPPSSTDGIHYSLFSKICTNPDRVRQYLDSSGKFSECMRGLRRVALTIGSEWLPDPYGPGYTITILGACGMSLGVKLSNAEKKLIRKYYKNCGLMRDAVPQFEEALDGYVNGTPWEFDSPGQKEIVEFRETRKEDLCFPGVMVNVWGPDHGREKEELAAWRMMVMNKVASGRLNNIDDLAQCIASASFDPVADPKTYHGATMADSHPERFRKAAQGVLEKFAPATASSDVSKFGNTVCGTCGAEHGKNGKALTRCGRCKVRLYCSRACQKKEYDAHRSQCFAWSLEAATAAAAVTGTAPTLDQAGKHGIVHDSEEDLEQAGVDGAEQDDEEGIESIAGLTIEEVD